MFEDILTLILESDANGDFIIDSNEVEELMLYINLATERFNEKKFRCKYVASDKSIASIISNLALFVEFKN